jgi:DNA-binding response OmpR family regulator
MCPFTFHCAKPARRFVWIVDAHSLNYGHLLSDRKAEQMDIRFLASGRELLHSWQRGRPDVCFVNLQMPDFSGFDLVEMIQPFPEGTTVYLLADRYVLEDEVRALSLGVHSYLCKPLEAELFFDFSVESRAKREVTMCAVASPTVHLLLENDSNTPVICSLKKYERR